MPLLYGDPDVTAAAWTCPMHPEVMSTEQGTCPTCGMKLIPAEPTAPAAWTCPMHPEVMSTEQGTCPTCGMKLIAAAEDAVGSVGHSHLHAHEMSDGLEWEDLMPEINRASDSGNMIWKLVDRDTGKANWEIDWAFEVGDQVKIRLVNDLDQDHPMHHPFHIHGAGRFLVLVPGRRTGRQSGVEGHRPRPLQRDRRDPPRRHQPGLVDGALPHRGTQPERNDVQLPGD